MFASPSKHRDDERALDEDNDDAQRGAVAVAPSVEPSLLGALMFGARGRLQRAADVVVGHSSFSHADQTAASIFRGAGLTSSPMVRARFVLLAAVT
jgi:hypothetical protein